MLTHFYLNLHEANAPQQNGSLNATDLMLSRVVGCLAGSLSYDDTDHSAMNDMHVEDGLLSVGKKPEEERYIDVEISAALTSTSDSTSIHD